MIDENNDFEFEDTNQDGESSANDKLKKLREELKAAREESIKNLDGWQRARADYANLQKSSSEQMKDLRGYVLDGLIEELLPTLDSFEMAMKNKATWEKVDENWRKGVEYIYGQLKGMLANNGITEIDKTGEKFNAEMHHAIEEIETDDENKDHTIAEINQKGYKGSKGILRPAQVKIFVKK